MFSRCTTPWNVNDTKKIEQLDVTDAPLVDLLFDKHENITSLFTDLISKRGTTLVAQEHLMHTEYFNSDGDVEESDVMIRLDVMLIRAGYIERILIAAQHTLYQFQRSAHDETDYGLGYFNQDDAVNISLWFQFNDKTVKMTVVKNGDEETITLYTHD